MNDLIAVGYWKSKEEYYLPNPRKLIPRYWEEDEKKNVLKYLRNGKEYIHWRGFSWCRFRCGADDAEMGAKCLTDGVFAWPEGFAHYVEEHNIPIPKKFYEHMKAQNFIVPEIDIPNDGKRMEHLDITYWLSEWEEWPDKKIQPPPPANN